jgi:hypothetical protein
MSKRRHERYGDKPGDCPKCRAKSRVLAKGLGEWTEDRKCSNGHEFVVIYSRDDQGAFTTEAC